MNNKNKKWTDEEIQFLKFAYPNKDFTVNEIAEVLKRSKNSVKTKAKLLNLKVYQIEIPEGHRICTKCENLLPLSYFTKRGDNKNLYRSWCRVCRNNDNRRYVKKIKYGNDIDVPDTGVPDIDVPEKKICKDCGIEKQICEFYKNKNNKDKHDNYCKECSKIRKEKSMLKKIQERGW